MSLNWQDGKQVDDAELDEMYCAFYETRNDPPIQRSWLRQHWPGIAFLLIVAALTAFACEKAWQR